MQKTLRPHSGFTLIELLVVITIIALLSVIGLVTFSQASVNSRNARRKADLAQLQSALVVYRTDLGTYPIFTSGTGFTNYTSMINDLQTKGYFNQPPQYGPLGAANDAYTYTVDTAGRTFSICVTLERTTPPTYCVYNP
jgi:prepilin-type N-terminal cleavage/methylation domain-containing protein